MASLLSAPSCTFSITSMLAEAMAIEASTTFIAILTPWANAAIGTPTPVEALATSTAVTKALTPVKHQLIVSRCFLYNSLALWSAELFTLSSLFCLSFPGIHVPFCVGTPFFNGPSYKSPFSNNILASLGKLPSFGQNPVIETVPLLLTRYMVPSP